MSILNDIATACANAKLFFHAAHLNVVGPNFRPLHKQYREIYEFFDSWFDRFAERLRYHGELFDPGMIAGSGPSGRDDFVKEAISELDEICDMQKELLEDTQDDPVTNNMILEFMEGVGKFEWMMRATAGGGK